MAKQHMNIKVETAPNGYALDVDDAHYMYLNIKGLLQGFMYHVGLGELGTANSKTISEFIAASMEWRADEGKTTKELLKLKKQNEALTSLCDNLRKQLKLATAKTKPEVDTED